MSHAKQTLIAFVVVTMGIWGCARGPEGGSSSYADRIHALEGRNAKLEDDFRATAVTRDQLRKKLAAAEEQQQKLRQELDQQLQVITKDREELRERLTERTTERDGLAVQYEQFRKQIRELLGQADAALNRPAADHPVTSAEVVIPGKS